MPEAYIVDAVRSPVGRRGEGLAAVNPIDLGAHAIAALVERSGVDAGAFSRASGPPSEATDVCPTTSTSASVRRIEPRPSSAATESPANGSGS